MPLEPISIPVSSIAARLASEMIRRALKEGDKAKAERLRRRWQKYARPPNAP